MRRLVPAEELPYRRAAQIRVIYADTDRMGVVYHGTYLRYLEHARVEFIRSLGFAYAEMERGGHGLPVIDLALTYLAPATYDDRVSVYVAMSKLTLARIHFRYRVTVEPGDRHDFSGPEPLELLRAETRHGCMNLADHRPTRFPDEVFELLDAHWTHQQEAQQEGRSP